MRASRNASGARRAAADFPSFEAAVALEKRGELGAAIRDAMEGSFDRRVGEQFSIAPGRVTDRDRQAYRAMKAQASRPPLPLPPGAVLDGEPFAANWATFLKAIREDGPERQRIANAWTERIPSEGGFLVPWSLTQDVFAYLTSAVIWPRASRLEMGTYRVGLPLLDNPSQADGAQGLGGITFAITEDGDAIPASNPQFGSTWLEAQKLAALVSPVPNELPEDAEAAFSVLFSRVVGMGLAWELDDLFFNGTGAGEPEGILNCPAAFTVTRTNSSDPPVHADVVAMLKGLHPASKKTATWLASEDTFDALIDEYLSVGSPTTQAVAPPLALQFDAGRGCWTLFGMDIEVGDHQPAAGTPGDLCLADLSLYQAGVREAMTVERSAMGATFISGSSAYRIRLRADGRYLVRSAYTLANGKTCSPLVVLQ